MVTPAEQAAKNKKLTQAQVGVSAGSASLSWIPFVGPIIAGAGALTSGLMELGKKDVTPQVPLAERASLGIQTQNLERISNMQGLSQSDVGKIGAMGDKSRADMNAMVNSMPVMSMLDRQRLSDALTEPMKGVTQQQMDKIQYLGIGEDIRRAGMIANAGQAVTNTASTIHQQEMNIQEEKEKANAARHQAFAKSSAAVAVSMGKAIDFGQDAGWWGDKSPVDNDVSEGMTLLPDGGLERPDILDPTDINTPFQSQELTIDQTYKNPVANWEDNLSAEVDLDYEIGADYAGETPQQRSIRVKKLQMAQLNKSLNWMDTEGEYHGWT